MRTTLNLDDDLARAAKAKAAAEGRTLTSLVEQALREIMHGEAAPVPRSSQLPVFHGDGPAPGIDLSDPHALRDAMYEEEDAFYLPPPSCPGTDGAVARCQCADLRVP